ncbi:MAG: hypothetical protein K2X48_05420 [Chitinophagaceae bacterium]|nr:hypothetical protein [Chitinophagaceae bacterium]
MRWITKRLLNAADGEKQTTTRTKRIITAIVSFLLLAVAIFGRVGQYPLRWSDAFSQGNDYKGNLALNPFQSFFSTLQFRKSTHVDTEAVKQSYPLMQTYLGLPATNTVLNFERTVAARDTFSNAKPNVVLVICESFSAYKSSMWGNPLNTTPFFNALCSKGIFFNHCFTQRMVQHVACGPPSPVFLMFLLQKQPAAIWRW